MIRELNRYIMSDNGTKKVNAILLTVMSLLLSGIFTVLMWFGSLAIDFGKEASKSFDELKEAQYRHIIDELDVNSDQYRKIELNKHGIDENKNGIEDLKEDNKKIKKKIGGFN